MITFTINEVMEVRILLAFERRLSSNGRTLKLIVINFVGKSTFKQEKRVAHAAAIASLLNNEVMRKTYELERRGYKERCFKEEAIIRTNEGKRPEDRVNYTMTSCPCSRCNKGRL